MDFSCGMIAVPYRGPYANAAVMSDLLLRRVSEGRIGVEAPDDYDVIGAGRAGTIPLRQQPNKPGPYSSNSSRFGPRGERDAGGGPPKKSPGLAAGAHNSRKERRQLKDEGVVRKVLWITTPSRPAT
jgi:hypothetical protein